MEREWGLLNDVEPFVRVSRSARQRARGLLRVGGVKWTAMKALKGGCSIIRQRPIESSDAEFYDAPLPGGVEIQYFLQ